MVKAWYLADKIDDPRQECRRDPPEYLTLEELARTGVLYRHIPVSEMEEGIAEVSKRNGYTYKDECLINREKMPNYDEKIKTFFEEHLHTDEEVRYIVEGSGYFDVRDVNDQWIRILVVPGDFLIVPAGIYHRFTVTPADYIRCVRLFKGEPIWTPHNRSASAEEMPARKDYVRVFVHTRSDAHILQF